jgi:Family of unknown function (DUF6504)
MVRRYEDPVEVRQSPDDDRPGSFLWRGRLYVVRDVLGHWRERQAWWTSSAARAVHGEGPNGEGPNGEARTSGASAALAAECEVWRVEASRGRVHGSGVFDLRTDVAGAGAGAGGMGTRGVAWRLVRVVD